MTPKQKLASLIAEARIIEYEIRHAETDAERERLYESLSECEIDMDSLREEEWTST